MFLLVFLRQGVFQCLLHLAPRASGANKDPVRDDFERLCRHIYYEYPQLVGSFVHMFRALFEEKEDEDGIGDD